MQRRELLGGGAAAGVSAIGSALFGGPLGGCVSTPRGAMPGLPAPPDMGAFCFDLESKLGGIAESRFVDGFVARLGVGRPVSAARQERVQARESVFRRSLRSLYLSQTFRDLPPESQAHPELQALMQRHLPELDQSVLEMTELLEGLSPEQRRATREELQRRPDLALQIAEVVDEHATSAGVSSNRRGQFRSMLTHASFRLRHGSPDALIDEYTGKVRRALAPDGASRALALSAAAQATSELFFAQAGGVAQTGGGATPSSPPTTPPTTPPPQRAGRGKPVRPPGPAPSSAPSAAPAKSTLTTGAWMLGIGAITFGASTGIVAAGGSAFVLGMTIGALLFAIGLIVVIVGALINATQGDVPGPPVAEGP